MTRHEVKSGQNEFPLDRSIIHTFPDKKSQCLMVHVENYRSVEDVFLGNHDFNKAVGSFRGKKLRIIFHQSVFSSQRTREIKFKAAFGTLKETQITHMAIVLPVHWRNNRFFGLLEDGSDSRHVICRTFYRTISAVEWLSKIRKNLSKR